MDVCLVTGGAGFIGSHLVKALVARKCTVRVLDNLSTGTLANLGRCARDVEMIVGDLEDLDLVREMVDGVDVVFHLADAPPDEVSVGPSGFPSQCDLGTAHVLIASRDSHVRRVVYASGTEVYGRGPPIPLAETDPTEPVSPFALAKLSGEQSCTAFTLHYGLETVRLRYSNVFGPRQSASCIHARIVPDALAAMLAGQRPPFGGSGTAQQDLIFIADVVQATLLAADTTGASGRVFNIAQGRMTTACAVVEALNDILDTHLVGVPNGIAPAHEHQTCVDIARAVAELRFCPSTTLHDGLLRCVRSLSSGMIVGPKQGLQRFTEA